MTKRKLIDANALLAGLYDENPKDVALYIANFPEASCMNPEKMHDTDDMISRKAAIEAVDETIEILKNVLDDFDIVGVSREKYEWGLDMMQSTRAEIKELPSVQPERTGKWIYGEHDIAMCDGYMCDKCGYFVPWDYQHKFIDFIKDYNYCPNCGARMEEEQE